MNQFIAKENRDINKLISNHDSKGPFLNHTTQILYDAEGIEGYSIREIQEIFTNIIPNISNPVTDTRVKKFNWTIVLARATINDADLIVQHIVDEIDNYENVIRVDERQISDDKITLNCKVLHPNDDVDTDEEEKGTESNKKTDTI